MAKRQIKVKKKEKKRVVDGIAHIKATFNNTLITITSRTGDMISASSAGACDFRGSRKSTPHAAKVAAENASDSAKDTGLKNIIIKVRGPGPGREMAIKAISASFNVTELVDVTGVPFNGTRPPKERRV